jgi:SAM-dependent methyltransferase
MTEADRIRCEYQRRARELPEDAYALTRPVNLYFAQQRVRHALALLGRENAFPLGGKRVLEVGCGGGGWLPTFEAWGVRRDDLAGIDLDEARVERARRLLSADYNESGKLQAPGADLRLGDAATLPWDNAAFDLVVQSTVFSSVLDSAMKWSIAFEMLRVLKPGGFLLWYDFRFNNPWNPHVRGVGLPEIESLFPNCRRRVRRVTLAPPLARKLVPLTWIGSQVLEGLGFLNTHYLGVFRKVEASEIDSGGAQKCHSTGGILP